jgi:hypothetical protein
MSEGGHHHGADMGGQPGFSDPGFQPQMFPPPEPDLHPYDIADPPDLTPRAYGSRRSRVRRPRPRAGSPAWVVQWIVRLAVIAFMLYVAFQIFHGAPSTP